jgi:general secretion pathway protein K
MRIGCQVVGRCGPSQGFALLIVLWILTLLSVMAASFSFSMRTESILTTNLVDRARAEALVTAGIHRGILELYRSEQESQWRHDGTVYSIPFGKHQIHVSILSENGKIDLNAAPEALIQGLFSSLGTEVDGQRLADAILDWRDRDHDRRLHGAEDLQYASAGRPYGARDAPYLTVEELDQVLGLTAELVRQVKPAVTVFSGQSKIDPNTAPRQALLAIPDMDPDQVDQFIATRAHLDPSELESAVNLLLAGNEQYLSPSKGNVYTIRAEVGLPNGVRVRRAAVIKLMQGARRPYSVLAWFDDNARNPSSTHELPDEG